MLLPAGASNHGECPKHWILASKDDTLPFRVVIVVVHVNWKWKLLQPSGQTISLRCLSVVQLIFMLNCMTVLGEQDHSRYSMCVLSQNVAFGI